MSSLYTYTCTTLIINNYAQVCKKPPNILRKLKKIYWLCIQSKCNISRSSSIIHLLKVTSVCCMCQMLFHCCSLVLQSEIQTVLPFLAKQSRLSGPAPLLQGAESVSHQFLEVKSNQLFLRWEENWGMKQHLHQEKEIWKRFTWGKIL